MNKTTHYQLNQWEPEDQVRRTDFNEDNAKLDAALAGKAETAAMEALQAVVTGKADAAALTALQTVVNGKGNCRVEFGSYVGTGVKNETVSITTSFPPKLVIVSNGYFALMFRGAATTLVFRGNNTSSIQLTWRTDGVSWRIRNNDDSAEFILNGGGTHYYAAFG